MYMLLEPHVQSYIFTYKLYYTLFEKQSEELNAILLQHVNTQTSKNKIIYYLTHSHLNSRLEETKSKNQSNIVKDATSALASRRSSISSF